MSKSTKLKYDTLRGVFNGVALPNLGSSGGTTSLWAAFLTADPGFAGSTAAEGGYAQYARVLTDRSTAANGWSVTSGSSAASCSPVGNIDAPQNTSTSTGTFTHAAIYPSSNAVAADCLYIGAITPNINFGQNVTPQLTTSSSFTET